jgi:uncharacterized protein (TIGR04222 family)
VRRGANRDLAARPVELAYLNDGPRLVVFTGLAALRSHGLIRGITAGRDAALPDHASPLHTALLATLRRPRSGAQLLSDDRVRAATEVIGARLVRRGWILSAKHQARMRWFGVPGCAVAVWCFVAFGLTLPGFSEPGRPMQALGLLGLSVVLAVGTFLVVDVPPVTRAGRAVARRARAELRDRERGAVAWPLRVAVYGEPELWQLDAELARKCAAFSGTLPPFPSIRRRTFISRDWWRWSG